MKLVPIKDIEGVKCKPVPIEEIVNYESSEIPEMIDFMFRKRGAGLAAPQIGINRRFFIMKYGNKFISCYNPSYRKRGDKCFQSEEGCLSYGYETTKIKRYKLIGAKFTDKEGNPVSLKLNGFTSAVFQHETDHLDGKTIFYDPEKQ